MMRTENPRRSAFTLIELLVVIAIIALLISILMPALRCARTEARRAGCFANMKTLAMATNNYSSEFQDRIPSFTWKANENNPVGNVGNNPTQAAADQAVYILRTRADRPDFPRITGWIPHVLYSHLVLNDYMEQRLPEPAMACTEDALRLRWQEHPLDYDSVFQIGVEYPSNGSPRWPYSSSYQLAPAAWARDAISGNQRTTSQHGNSHNLYSSSQQPIGDRKFADIQFPSDKVAWYDSTDRHSCRSNPIYFAHEKASQPIAFFDGHVVTKKTRDANKGFRPNNPSQPVPTLMQYRPEPWEAPTVSGNPVEVVFGMYRWTRGGLRGRDFNGSEIDTSNW